MECNRDEAPKAKTVSEDKFWKQDYAGARKFALKAQTLCPGLDGISQMLATIDVYMSFENKQGGEVDWYGVLNVNPSADEDTIKKHYRKLALMLHPDKNKSVGADGAFKIILEAWSFLSDKEKRLAYNQRRAFRDAQTAQSRSNGVYNFGNRTTPDPNTQAANQTTQSGSNGAHNFGNRTTQVPKTAAQSQPNRTSNEGSKTSVPKAQSNGPNKATKQKPTQPSQKPDHFPCPQSKPNPSMATKTPSRQQTKPGVRKPVFVKVDALKPGTNGHTLVAKVVSSNIVLNKKPRNSAARGPVNTKIAECLVGDETGTILFTARNEQVDMMKAGNTVILRNAKIDMFKGFMRLAVDKWGRVEVTEPSQFAVKEDNNLSLVEYELMNVDEDS